MDITKYSLNRKTVIWVLLTLVLVGGLYSYFTLPQAEDPGFTVRTAQVITVYPGASPERVRDTVTNPLEDKIRELGGLDLVTSKSQEGVSIITVNASFDTKDLDKMWAELTDAVDEARGELPEGALDPRIEDNYGDVFSILLSLTGEGFSINELGDIAEDVRRELMKLSQISRVDIYGVPDREVVISYDRNNLQSLGLTPYALANAIQKTNVIRPSGSLKMGEEEISIEASGNFTSLDSLEEILIPLPEGRGVIPLQDLAAIQISSEEPLKTIVLQMGDEGVVLGINMREGGRITVMGKQVKNLVERLEKHYPVGLDFSYMIFQPDLVSGLIDDFTGNVIQAVLIVMAVMVMAAGLRDGLVVASLVPVTMIGTLFIMKLSGIGINQMSLASLIIVLGMLVDSGIVMSESIKTEIAMGKSPEEGAVIASRELRIPLLTSVLTTSAAFLPIAMAQNSAGEYTRPLFYVVTIALLLAWVLTLTLIPLLSVSFHGSRIDRKEKKESRIFERALRWYTGILTGILRGRSWFIGGIVIIFLASLVLFTKIPVSFFPPTTYSYFTVELTLPRGTSIEETGRVAGEIDQYLNQRSLFEGDVESFGSFIGGGVPRFRLNISPQDSRPEYAFFLVRTKEGKDMEPIFEDLRQFGKDSLPDGELKIQKFTYGPGFSSPVEIRLYGDNREQIYQAAEAIKDEMEDFSGIINIRDDWGVRRKVFQVEVDEGRARQLGITHQDVAVSLQMASLGVSVSEYRGEGMALPILIRDSRGGRNSFEDFEALSVYSESNGRSVPLAQVADISLVWQPSLIIQRDGLETITVQADVADDVNPITVTRELMERLNRENPGWDRGIQYETGGTSEGSTDANRAIIEQLPVALFIIIMLFVIQFNSLKKSLIILLTIPFGFVGVVFGLWVTGSTFSFMGLLGLVSLSGVVVNDAIILIERIDLERERGGGNEMQALYRATLRKFRPILLTSITTITGLIPLILFGGPLWLPMASALIFGLAFSTVLTLGLIPALYSAFFGLEKPHECPSMEEITI